MSDRSEVESRLDGIEEPKCKKFRYLGLMLQGNGMIDEDVMHRLK